MRLSYGLMAALVMAAGLPAAAQAETRYLAFEAADRTTQALTRGITLEVERGMFGATRVRGLFSTTSRGSAVFRPSSPSGIEAVLPQEARGGKPYSIQPDGDGAALSRALCPGSQEAWLVVGRVRSGHPVTLQAVGIWPDQKYRLCATLNYRYRGEWAQLPNAQSEMPADR